MQSKCVHPKASPIYGESGAVNGFVCLNCREKWWVATDRAIAIPAKPEASLATTQILERFGDLSFSARQNIALTRGQRVRQVRRRE